MEASTDDSLGDVLTAAAEALGMRVGQEAIDIGERLSEELGTEPPTGLVADTLRFVGFRQPDDDEVVASYPDSNIVILRRDQRLRQTVLVTRDRHGRAVWRRPPFSATVAEIIDASEMGLVAGDPRQVYLIPQIPQGDFGLLSEWDTFITALKVLWEAADVAARVAGAFAFGEFIVKARDRYRQGGADAIRANSEEWSKRGAAPQDLIRMLAMAPRRSDEVAALLGCDEEEAKAILWALGFFFDESSGKWSRAGDASAQLMADDIDLAFSPLLGQEGPAELLREIAARRAEQLGKTGEVPDVAADLEDLRRQARSESEGRPDR